MSRMVLSFQDDVFGWKIVNYSWRCLNNVFSVEFVVVGTLDQLRSASEQVQSDVLQLQHQLSAMRSKTKQVR